MTLSRRTPMKRGGPITSHNGQPLDRRRKSRSAEEFRRIYGSRERVAWVKSLPCIAASTFCAPTRENHHTVTGGMGRKADADTIVPLCAYHHAILHREGVATFSLLYRLDLTACAAATAAAWEAREA